MGFRGKERGASRGGRAPPWAGTNWTRRGRCPPPSFSPPSPSLLLLVGIRVGGANPTWTGSPSRTLPYGAPPMVGLLSSPLYIRGRGHPKDTQVSLSRVRCPPPQ